MKYPIGIQSFETIRRDGYVYVDKTDLIYKLAQGHVYFLARPRRFGKSLLISTLKAYFEGRRDLFEGLKIMELETEWTKYPVISFDFNGIVPSLENGLRSNITATLQATEKRYGVSPLMLNDGTDVTANVSLRFKHLIEELHEKTGQRVVVLIDEYDKPLLDLLDAGSTDDEQQLIANRELLKAFFSIFKSTDDHLRFVMLTGITKFSQVSMFSGFNQPDDISLDNRYDKLLGIILNTFSKLRMNDYWFSSGTPSYLVRLLGNSQEDIMSYTSGEHSLDEFLNYKADSAKPLPMIFQAGYLTVKDYDPEFEMYRLNYPNNEVKQGLMTLLANDYLKPDGQTASWIQKIVLALRDGDLDLVRRLFTSFLAETPYSMRPKKDQKDRERLRVGEQSSGMLYFHYTFYLLMRLISCYTVYTEKQLSEGRADCIIETPKYVYIFEFKLDGTADEALQQINERGYARAYEADARALYIIGASFSSKTGTIEEWKKN